MELEKVKSIEKVLEFKDEVILQLLQQREQKQAQLKETLEKAASDEIQEWAKLTDKFATELKKYQLVCFYCGVALEGGTVNEECSHNQNSLGQNDHLMIQGYTMKRPEMHFHGNRQHFYAPPNP